jgi:hypothetical protein
MEVLASHVVLHGMAWHLLQTIRSIFSALATFIVAVTPAARTSTAPTPYPGTQQRRRFTDEEKRAIMEGYQRFHTHSRLWKKVCSVLPAGVVA